VLLLCRVRCSGWNQPAAQAQMERTLQVICKELEADGVSVLDKAQH
jgi:hypothetical protein